MTDRTVAVPFAPSRAAKLALFFGLLGNAMGHAFLFGALPPLGRQMGLEDVQTGAVLSLGALGFLVAAPLWGHVSERWGRRPVLLIGFSMAAAAPAVFGALVQFRLAGALSIVAVFVLLVVARLAQSLTTGGLLPAAQAFIADMTTARKRTGGMGMMGAAFGLGGVIGAATLWAVAPIGVPLGFYVVAVVTAAAAVACWRHLAEPIRQAGVASPTAGAIRWHAIWPCLVITAFGVTIYGVLQQVTGLRLQDAFNLSPQEAARQAGALLTATALAMVFAQGVILQRLRWPPGQVIRLAAAVAIGAMVALAVAEGYATMIAAMMALGLCIGLLLPANLGLLSLRTGAGAQGRIAGINAIGQGLGMVAGPFLGAAIYQQSPAAPYWACAALFACLFLLTIFAAGNRAPRSADHPAKLEERT